MSQFKNLEPRKVRNESETLCYVSDEGVVNFDDIDIFSDVMLITAGCGRGKTTFVLNVDSNGLLGRINELIKGDIKPYEVLYLTTRTIIRQQQKEKNSRTTVDYGVVDYDSEFMAMVKDPSENKIRIATAHKFGELLKKNEINKFPKIIIFDELHSVFAETVFADSLYYTCKFIEENKDIIKIGLTATPQFLQNYVTEFVDIQFKTIDKALGSMYKANNITVVSNGSARTYMKKLKMEYDENNRLLVYMRSASECYEMSKIYPNSAFLVSQSCESKDKVTGELLCDIMDKQTTLGYIRTHGKYPDNIYVVFLNSAYREGLDLKDDRVKQVVCEATDLLTIEQVLGRLRQDLEHLVVVNNNKYRQMLMDNIKEMREYIAAYGEADPVTKGELFGARVEKQKLRNVPNIAFKHNGRHEFNYYAMAFYTYQLEYYNILERGEFSKYVRDGQRVDNNRQYFTKALEGYSHNKIAFVKGATVADAVRGVEIVGNFNLDEYLDKALAKADKERLCKELNVKNSDGRVAGWPTVKDMLVEVGYKVEDKRTKAARYTVIKKG